MRTRIPPLENPYVLVVTDGLPREEWLEYRRKGIGGSDAPAVLGVSPFATARDIYYDKLKIVSYEDPDENWVRKEMGNLLEDLVARIFHVRTGYPIYKIKKMFYHPDHPFMLADIDFFTVLPNGETAILEIKTTNAQALDSWWRDEIESVPVNYEIQGRHYMATMDVDHVFFCCFYGNDEYDIVIRHITRDALMKYITSDANILMAYRSIKRNSGSKTPGTDGLNIKHIEKLEPEVVCKRVRNILSNYQPRNVRRKDIPKPNGKTRPLGIPCIWNRLIQQCILQILEPICEAKFFDGSFGFRPLRSAENAINEVYRYINRSNLYYMIEVDIKGFFDNVNHTKLIRQIWAMGIRDKQLICIIKKILKAKIEMPDGTILTPTKGTPQGGIISPLLANIVLNELDWHMESQWGENPLAYKWKGGVAPNGTFSKGSSFREMRKTNLKEMHIIRYADDTKDLIKDLYAEVISSPSVKT